jgi:hypothetical protein
MLAAVDKRIANTFTLDLTRINSHEDTYLRFVCKKRRHNPQCSNDECAMFRKAGKIAVRDYAIGCDNFIVCGRQFYATPKQIKYAASVLNCEAMHIPAKCNGVIAALRVFELLFCDRFDDNAGDIRIEFTGYNKDLGIAFIHLSTAAADYATYVGDWCKTRNIDLVTIPTKYTGASKMCGYVVGELARLGRIASPDIAHKTLLENITLLNKRQSLFIDTPAAEPQ